MKVIIAGSRDVTNYSLVEKAVKDSGFKITEVVSGGARGVDALGEEWAKNNLKKKPKIFEANWKDLKAKGAIIKNGPYGPYNANAGFARNKEMAVYADALIVLIKNNSPGSSHMYDEMKQLKKKVYVVYV
jgi:predicted Rossmann fold nucleotide-binding protein DprA/Smf involved in DNA uptake